MWVHSRNSRMLLFKPALFEGLATSGNLLGACVQDALGVHGHSFPLGNAAGKPNDVDSQAFTMELALKVLESAVGPRTTVQSPLRWNEDGKWKLDFSNIEQMSDEEIARRKAEFDRNKQIAKERREKDIKSAAAAAE